jgi:hypothetical protein
MFTATVVFPTPPLPRGGGLLFFAQHPAGLFPQSLSLGESLLECLQGLFQVSNLLGPIPAFRLETLHLRFQCDLAFPRDSEGCARIGNPAALRGQGAQLLLFLQEVSAQLLGFPAGAGQIRLQRLALSNQRFGDVRGAPEQVQPFLEGGDTALDCRQFGLKAKV